MIAFRCSPVSLSAGIQVLLSRVHPSTHLPTTSAANGGMLHIVDAMATVSQLSKVGMIGALGTFKARCAAVHSAEDGKACARAALASGGLMHALHALMLQGLDEADKGVEGGAAQWQRCGADLQRMAAELSCMMSELLDMCATLVSMGAAGVLHAFSGIEAAACATVEDILAVCMEVLGGWAWMGCMTGCMSRGAGHGWGALLGDAGCWTHG